MLGSDGDVTCRGTAAARGGGTSLELVFGDGAVLRWDAAATSPGVAPPVLADGQTAWVDYRQSVTVVCTFCGSYRTRLMEIRAGAGGALIWVGREGVGLPEVSADLVLELFGVAARAEPVCHETIAPGCWREVNRDVFEHVLLTTPEQRIPSARLSHLTTSLGEYDVFWTHSIEQGGGRRSDCFDGPDLAHDNAFAVNWTAPPAAP
ncbi:MAG TPA: hypothetical protein VFH68_14230 [Polyangia bacterium]|nr:hypothetical protein [Polyangia bacterium]